MAYQALYRKWRPSVFEDVVGQNHIVETLKNQINANKIAHAYLFCGSRGTGKTSTAKIFSRAINCEHPINGNPCNECDTCKGIMNNSIFDVVEIDGASNNKVDDVRNIRDDVVYPPANAKYKVYIIDEVHMLSNEAFNALLKTLEEPPHYVIFILATTEFHKIPATIISRCQKFDFKRITYNDTAARIRKVAEADNINVTESAVKLIAKAADGSLRDGLSKLDQCIALGLTKIDYRDVANIIGASDPEFLADFCDAIIEERLGDALKLLDSGVNTGMDPLRLFTDVIDYFRDLMMIKTSGDYSLIINSEEEVLTRYKNQCEKLSLSRLLKIIETLFDGQNISKYSVSPKLSFETALLKIASKNTDKDVDALLDRLEMLEQQVKKLSENKEIVVQKVISSEVKEECPKDDAHQYESAVETETEEIYTQSDKTVESDEISEFQEAVEPEDEEYDFSAQYEEDDDYEGYTIPQSDNYEPMVSEEQLAEADGQAVISHEEATQDAIKEASEKTPSGTVEILNYIKLNFRDFSVNIRNKDIAFDTVMLTTEISVDDNSLIFTFENKSKLDIAKNSKYDILIQDAIYETYDIRVAVKLKGDSEEAADIENAEDPLEELFKMAEQNQIIFKFED